MGTLAIKKTFGIFLLISLIGCNSGFKIDEKASNDLSNLISLETKPDGTGQKINTNILLDLDEVMDVYAVYRNAQGEFVKAVEVSWRLVGGLGNLTILSNGTSAQFSSSSSGTATVQVLYNDTVINETVIDINDLVLPELTWVANTVTTAEGTNAELTVELTKVYDQLVSFEVTTADASAVAGLDYTGKSSEVITIPIGQTQATLSIPVLADNYYEASDESFTITLSNFKKTFMNTSSTATVTVTNQDAVPEITLSDLTVNEDVGEASVTLSLSYASAVAAEVSYATGDISTDSTGDYIDYTSATGSVSFPADSTTAEVKITINDDNLDEVNEQLSLSLNSPVNASLATKTSSIITINDNDLPSSVSIADTSVVEGGVASLTVSFSPATGQAVGFNWSTQNDGATAPTDYTAQASTAVSVPKHTTSVTLNVTTIDNSTVCQVGRDLLVNLSNLDKLTDLKDSANLDILENDVVNIVISDSIATEGDGNATYTASLSEACALNVSFEYKTFPLDADEGHDYTYTTGIATLTGGAPTNISVPIVDDTLNEGPQRFLLAALNNSNLVNAKASSTSTAITTINDNDAAETPSVLDFGSANHSRCAVMGDGDVKCWGALYEVFHYGEFNIGDEASDMGVNLSKLNVGSVNGDGNAPFYTFKDVSVSNDAVCAIRSDDQLKCWGENYHSQLGIGNGRTDWGAKADQLGDNLKSVALDSNNIPESIYTSYLSTCAIMHASATPTTKFAKCWGDQWASGQGDGSGRIGESEFDVRDLPPINFGAGLTPEQISIGKEHTCAVLSNGSVKCFGKNNDGQLGINSTSNVGDNDSTIGDSMPTAILGGTAVQQVSAGNDYNCALFLNNRIKCWGRDSSGRAGRGATNYNFSDTTIGNNPGEMEILGFMDLGSKDDNADGTPDEVNPLEFTKIFTGDNHSCAITTDGGVKCWGLNSYGQLGYGNTENVDNSSEFGDSLTYVDLGADGGSSLFAIDLFLGENHTCAVLNNNSVKCWGRNDLGQLGLGHASNIGDEPGEMGDNLPVVDLNGNAVKLSSGGYSSNYQCAIMDTGEAKCWGNNTRYNMMLATNFGYGDEPGEMGGSLPSLNINASVNARQIQMTSKFNCVLDASGDIYCWGSQDDGALGNGVASSLLIGRNATHLGAFPKVLLPTGKKAIQLATSGRTGCALLDDFTVRCWGDNGNGEVGIGSTDSDVGDSPSELGDNMQAVDFGVNNYPISLVGYSAHSETSGAFCALLNNQEVKCWGDNSHGVVGIEVSDTRYGNDPSELGDSWPSVMFGDTGFTAGGPKVKKVIGAKEKFCALFENQKIKCWGRNYYGILGYEDFVGRGNTFGSMGNNLEFVNLGTGVLVQDIYNSTSENSCVLTTTGKVKCWGFHNGQGPDYLGSSPLAWSIGGEAGQMGDSLTDSMYGTDSILKIANSCSLHTNGRLRCFATNDYGKLGQETSSYLPYRYPNLGDNIPYIKLETGH